MRGEDVRRKLLHRLPKPPCVVRTCDVIYKFAECVVGAEQRLVVCCEPDLPWDDRGKGDKAENQDRPPTIGPVEEDRHAQYDHQ